MTIQEYKENYGDNPVAEKDHDIEVKLWYTDEEIPTGEYYGTVKERAELDANSIIDDFEQEYDIENCDGKEKLKELVEEWNKTYGVDLYYINEKCEVIVL